MTHFIHGSAQASALLIAATLLLGGCSDSDKISEPVEPPTTESAYRPNNSEANLLENLTQSYVERDIDGYAMLFDPTEFEFVFDPFDAAADPRIPPFWEWPRDWAATRNLFNSPLVLEVKVDFVRGPTLAAEASDGVSLDWTKTITTNVQLSIDTIDPQGGENIIYKVAGDRGTFFFKDYPDELIDGQPRQRIVEWRDQRVGLVLPTELTTWGQIKNVWR